MENPLHKLSDDSVFAAFKFAYDRGDEMDGRMAADDEATHCMEAYDMDGWDIHPVFDRIGDYIKANPRPMRDRRSAICDPTTY